MMLPALLLTLASGSFIDLVLGLVGGGGSILAVPLLAYIVGVPSAHAAIGTAAVQSPSMLPQPRWPRAAGNVKWPCAVVFAVTGVVGVALGAAAS